MSRPVPDTRAAYAHFEPLATRWADNDIYGHMNNAVHYQLFDTAVNGFLVRRGILDMGQSETVFLVVSSSCDYFAELAFPDRVDAGLRVARLGSSSVRYEIGLFQGDAETAAAQGHFVHVNVGRADRKPQPMAGPVRAILQELVVAG
ncbi:MAG: thioesterase family protein [Pseudomonadota bacterium]